MENFGGNNSGFTNLILSDDQRSKLKDASFKFAFDSLQKYILKNPKNNIFFSPHLIYQNLLMIYMGSNDDIGNSLKQVLHIPDEISKTLMWCYYTTLGVLRFSYAVTGVSSAYTCRIFSRLWVTDCKKLTTNTEKLGWSGHRITKIDFNNRPDQKRIFINNCIKSVTKSCIQDLLPPDSIHSKTDLVLTNAIYFKTGIKRGRRWNNFKSNENSDSDSPGTCSARPVNSDDTKNDGNFENKNFDQNDKSKPNKPNKKIIIKELSSFHRDISMFFLYVKDDSKIEESDKIIKCLEYLMTDKGLEQIRRKLDSEELRENEQFPTFKFVQDLRMYELLELLGVPELTPSGTAYLKNHFSTHDLKLGDTVHRASIEITTDHVIAAASNAFFTDNPSQHEHVDIGGDYVHLPSICLIYDKEHQNILFCGAMLKEMKETAI